MKPPVPVHISMRKKREAAGVSQSELARRANIYQPYLSRFESGAAVPDVCTAIDLANALGLTLEEYLGLDVPPP